MFFSGGAFVYAYLAGRRQHFAGDEGFFLSEHFAIIALLGVDPKHGDKNKMTSLHYTMINFNAGYEQIQFLVEAGADINAKMAQEIDCLDLVIYTQNMKNANYHRILGLVRYLVKNMECKDFDLRKLTVISAMLTWDRLQMCKLRNNVANMKPQKGCFVLPEAVFGHLAQYV